MQVRVTPAYGQGCNSSVPDARVIPQPGELGGPLRPLSTAANYWDERISAGIMTDPNRVLPQCSLRSRVTSRGVCHPEPRRSARRRRSAWAAGTSASGSKPRTIRLVAYLTRTRTITQRKGVGSGTPEKFRPVRQRRGLKLPAWLDTSGGRRRRQEGSRTAVCPRTSP